MRRGKAEREEKAARDKEEGEKQGEKMGDVDTIIINRKENTTGLEVSFLTEVFLEYSIFLIRSKCLEVSGRLDHEIKFYTF